MNQKIKQGLVTADRILAVARRVFEKKGFQAATTQEIVDKAKITKGALYHHFASKRDLFEAVYRATEEQMGRKIQESSGSKKAPFDQLVAGCFAYLECCAEDGFHRILRLDGPAALGTEQWQAIDREYGVNRLLPFLSELQNKGVIRTANVEAFAYQLTGAMNEATFWIAQQTSKSKALADSKKVLAGLLESVRVQAQIKIG